jgi:hypothetical protein
MSPMPVPPSSPPSDSSGASATPAAAASTHPAPASPTGQRRWLREPLLHFALAGAALFALDAWVVAGRDDPNTITLTTAVDGELRQLFVEGRGRPPTDAELASLRQRWFDNEMLYREGLALGLDRGDPGIRERVIFKALNVVEAGLQRPVADEATLQAWFEQQRARYDEPPRVDLFEAVMPGKPSADEVAAFVKALNAGRADTQEAGLRIFRARPMGSIQESFGADFAAVLADLPLKTWHALDTPNGPRAMMVEVRTPGRAVTLDEVRDRVLPDWRDQRMAELRTAGVRALADKYALRVAAQPQP